MICRICSGFETKSGWGDSYIIGGVIMVLFDRKSVCALALSLGLSLTVTVTGCADVPDDVKTGSRGEADTVSAAESFISVGDSVDGAAEDIKGRAFDNITVNSDLVVQSADKLYDGKLMAISGFDSKAEDIFKHYIGDEYDESKMIFDEHTYPTGPEYSDGDWYISVGCNGFVNYQHCLTADIYNNSALADYYAFKDDDVNNIGGKDVSVLQAAEIAQAFADDLVEFTDYPNDIKVSHISLCKGDNDENGNDNGNDNEFYVVYFEMEYEGCPMLSYMPTTADDDIAIPTAVAYIEGDEVNCFIVQVGFECYGDKEEIGEVISPQSAVDKVSGGLSQYIGLDLKRVSLQYILSLDGNVQPTEEGEGKDIDKAPWTTFASYNTFVCKPYWVLYFDESAGRETFALYDIASGEIQFVDTGYLHT